MDYHRIRLRKCQCCYIHEFVSVSGLPLKNLYVWSIKLFASSICFISAVSLHSHTEFELISTIHYFHYSKPGFVPNPLVVAIPVLEGHSFLPSWLVK